MKKINNKILFVSLIVILSVLLDQVTKMVAFIQKDKIGDGIKILDLAYRMIHLSGLKPIDNNNPDGDIKIKFTGLRPGEKLYEELLIGDDVIQSKHPRIMQAREEKLSLNKVEDFIDKIKKSRDLQNENIIKDLLLENVKGYTTEFEYKQ